MVVPSINSSALNNLRLLDTVRLDELFDHTEIRQGQESYNETEMLSLPSQISSKGVNFVFHPFDELHASP